MIDFKISKFNTYIQKNGVTLCYNSMHDCFIAIPTPTYNEYIKKINNLDKLIKEEPKLSESLKENGFIVPQEEDELYKLRLFNKEGTFRSRDYSLTLIPSLDCNLRCWYCFESHVKDSIMSNEVMERIVKHIQNKIDHHELEYLILDWFGGEPLLNFDKVAYPLSMKIKQLLERYNLSFNNFFVTNASLITDEMIPKLSEINARFQITLDGDRERHDKIRFRKQDKTGTYDQIINAIHNINNKMNNSFVNVRINYDDQTLKNFEQILYDLNELDRKKVRVHLERIWQTKVKPNNELLKNTLNLLMANGFDVSYINFNIRPYACKAEKDNGAAIIYDGNVYKCTGRDFVSIEPDGYLNEGGDIEWKRDKVAKRLGLATFENEMCLQCNLLPMCMGPCSQKVMEKWLDNLKDVCTLNWIELSVEDYLTYKYNNNYNLQKRKGNES